MAGSWGNSVTIPIDIIGIKSIQCQPKMRPYSHHGPGTLHRYIKLSIAALTISVLGACNTSDVSAPTPPAEGSLTVDASKGFAYISLADGKPVTLAGPAIESSAWDIAIFGTTVTLNGGQAGPGGVTGFCVCQNSAESLSNSDWLALTADGELADFDAVTSVPASANFTADVLSPAMTNWYSGAGSNAVAISNALYFVRLSDSSGVAKVRVKSVQNPTATHAGVVELEYAIAANNADFGEVRTATIDLSSGPKAFDFEQGQVTTSPTSWDLRFDGFLVRANGGVSGPGKGAVATLEDEAFETAEPTAVPANAFRIDSYAGVFGNYPYYKYNLAGDHRITPTFDVYLIKRGSTVYKLQITGYYNATGTARHISLRYEQIAP